MKIPCQPMAGWRLRCAAGLRMKNEGRADEKEGVRRENERGRAEEMVRNEKGNDKIFSLHLCDCAHCCLWAAFSFCACASALHHTHYLALFASPSAASNQVAVG